jgi:hypothetical protein
VDGVRGGLHRRVPGIAGWDAALRGVRSAAGRLSCRLGGRSVLGAQCLHRCVRRDAHPWRRSRGPVRAQADLLVGRAALPGGVSGMRTGLQRRAPDRGPRPAGGRCGDAHAFVAVTRAGCVPLVEAIDRRESLGRGRRARRRDRSRPRLADRRDLGMAVGLLSQSADRIVVGLEGIDAAARASRGQPTGRGRSTGSEWDF